MSTQIKFVSTCPGSFFVKGLKVFTKQPVHLKSVNFGNNTLTIKGTPTVLGSSLDICDNNVFSGLGHVVNVSTSDNNVNDSYNVTNSYNNSHNTNFGICGLIKFGLRSAKELFKKDNDVGNDTDKVQPKLVNFSFEDYGISNPSLSSIGTSASSTFEVVRLTYRCVAMSS